MKLGKRYSLLKKRYNAASIVATFTRRSDNEEMKISRKLSIMVVLSLFGCKINKKAYIRELNKSSLNGRNTKEVR